MKPSLEIVAVFAAWICLNVGLNYYNNWLMSPPPVGIGFSAGLLYTMCHMVAGALGSLILMAMRPELGKISCTQFLQSKWKLLSLSFLFALSIGTNNLSLAHLGLSVNQVLKSTCALFVLIISFFLEGKRYSFLRIFLILLVVLGTSLSAAAPGGNM